MNVEFGMNFAVRIIALCIMVPPSVIGLYRWYEFEQMSKSAMRHHEASKRFQPSAAQQRELEAHQLRRARMAERRREYQLRRDRLKLQNNRNSDRAKRRAQQRRYKPTVIIQR